MRTLRAVPATIILAAALACVTRQAAPPDTQADIAAITRITHEWTAAVQSGDLEGIVGPFTADAVLMPPNEPAAVGTEAIRAWSQGLMGQLVFDSARVTVDIVEVAGDLAVSRGLFHATFHPKAGGAAASDVNKYVLTWRRQTDRTWKITSDIWSSNNPAPGS